MQILFYNNNTFCSGKLKLKCVATNIQNNECVPKPLRVAKKDRNIETKVFNTSFLTSENPK